jgi:hypothetical protein
MAPQRRRWHWYVAIRASGWWRSMACTTAVVTRTAGREPHRGQLAASRSRRNESAAAAAAGSWMDKGTSFSGNENGPVLAAVPGGAVAGRCIFVFWGALGSKGRGIASSNSSRSRLHDNYNHTFGETKPLNGIGVPSTAREYQRHGACALGHFDRIIPVEPAPCSAILRHLVRPERWDRSAGPRTDAVATLSSPGASMGNGRTATAAAGAERACRRRVGAEKRVLLVSTSATSPQSP